MKMKRYTKSKLLEAIKGSKGVISVIAKRLDCSWATARMNIQRFPDTLQAYHDEEDTAIDKAEVELLKLIDNADSAMIKFYLMTKGKARGYTYEVDTKTELQTDNEIKIKIE